MEFCPTCGMRLALYKKKEGKKSLSLLVCPKCGYEKQTTSKSIVHQNITKHSQEPITVIGREAQKLRTMPTVRIECPKCGNNIAFAWQVQTRGSDESSTQFFRCTRCKYTFREYS